MEENKRRFFDAHRSNRTGLSGVRRVVGWTIAGLSLAVVLAFVFGFIVKLLWGWTLTPLFGLKEPSYWQAVGLIILARLLFGGWSHRHDHSKKGDHFARLHDRFHAWKANSKGPASEPEMPSQEGEHYREFWEKEGKQAFEAYIKKTGDA